MPPSTRSKRVFAKTSPNSLSEPAVKRRSTGRVGAENNNTTSAKKASNSHKPRKQEPESRKVTTSTNGTAKIATHAHPKTWICICEDAVQHRCTVSPECRCMRLADENRDHKWIITKKGADLYREWHLGQMRRDAEAFDVFAYNDYSGYGTGEVVENMLSAFDTVMNSKRKNIWVMWAHIEGMARFLSQDNLKWYHIDNSQTNAKRVMLIGTAILTTIDYLVAAGMFSDDSEIQNIGFILGLLLQFVVEFRETCETNEDGWRLSVVRKTDKSGLTIRGLYSCTIGSLVENIRGDMDESELEEEEKDLKNENVEKVDERPNLVRAYDPAPYSPVSTNGVPKLGLAAFSKSYGVDGKIGGDHYDLTAEHNRVSF